MNTNNYPWYIRLIFWLQQRRYGAALNSARMWGKSPKIFLALSFLYRAIDRKKSPISPLLRSLIIVRVSQLNGCSFCIDLNSAVLIERGAQLDKVRALTNWQTSHLFDENEKLILEYTEAVTRSTSKINDELRHKMNSNFTEEDLVEITALIAFQNMSTKFNNAFAIESQGFCEVRN